jgi:hypothetical protein
MKQCLCNIILSLFFVAFFDSSYSVAMNSELKIVQIKINNKIAIWPSLESAQLIQYSKLNKDGMPENLELIASPSEVAFKFEYFGKGKPQFRYILKGYEKNWHYLDSCQFVKFKNLKHGKYNFVIQAIQENKIFSQSSFDFYYDNISSLATIDLVNLCLIILFIYLTIKLK